MTCRSPRNVILAKRERAIPCHLESLAIGRYVDLLNELGPSVSLRVFTVREKEGM